MADDSERTKQRIGSIIRAIAEDRCVLFLGAGANVGGTDKAGRPLPCTGAALAECLIDRFGISVPDTALSSVAEYADAVAGRGAVVQYIRELLTDAVPPVHLLELAKYRWRSIYTTNFDTLTETAYSTWGQGPQRCFAMVSARDSLSALAADDVPLYKLHGCISRPSEPGAELVLTRRDYNRAMSNRQQLLSRLSADRGSYTILYVGHSIRDTDLLAILDELEEAVGREWLPRSYCLMPEHSAYDEQVFENRKITLVDLTAADFFANLSANIESARSAVAASPRRGPRSGGSECEEAVRRLDSRTQALLASNHEILGPLILEDPSNERDFFRGDLPSWGIFLKELDAQRTLYDEIMDDLYDHVDDKPRGPRCLAVVSEAGAGKSVFLRRLAFDLVVEWQAPVLFTHDAAELHYDALEALITTLGRRLFLFVDRASHHAADIVSIVRRAEAVGLKITIVCGDRANEWHDATRNLPLRKVHEYLLECLDDNEIQKVLDVMGRAGMLGNLQALAPDQRFNEIKERAGKQLLVALREATEGKRFDEIIADEYQGLPTDDARQCYMVVCALHALGAPTRLGLLHRLTGIPYGDFKARVFDPAEGVIVQAEDVSATYGPYVTESYRSRHETIAGVVFSSCVPSDEERLGILRSAVQHLDPGQREDKAAIRLLTQGLPELDGIGDYSCRSSVFEALAAVDPQNAFVLQHWARLAAEAGAFGEAKQRIDGALQLRPGDPHLLHTKARVLAEGAHQTRDAIRRERMYREANEIFEACKRKERSSTYPYHAQARMFFDRAADAESGAEKLKHAREGYRIIAEGLQCCHNRGILYQELGEVFDRLFQDYEKSRDAFEKAVAADSKDVPSRYLYARMEYRQRNYGKACEILGEALAIDSSDANCLYWRARCEEELRFDNEIEILGLYERARAESNGDSQIAFREGCYLYRRGRSSQAKKVFETIDQEAMSYSDKTRRRLTFIDPESGQPVRCRGSVVNKGAYHVFVRREGFGDDVYGSLRDTGPEVRRVLYPGAKVIFSIYFNLMGPVVYDLRSQT